METSKLSDEDLLILRTAKTAFSARLMHAFRLAITDEPIERALLVETLEYAIRKNAMEEYYLDIEVRKRKLEVKG